MSSTVPDRSVLRHALQGVGSVAPIAAVLAATAFSSMARAQVLEEIVVTSERRAMDLQRTPLSVAAFTADTMEFKGLQTIEDVAANTPNLDIKGSRGSGNAQPVYQIRGLSGGGDAVAERATAMYIDGVFMPRTTGPFLNTLDIERIEILRGPQGTLFGRNSTGGAIRVFTRQPGPDLEGHLRVTGGNFDRLDVNAMVNVPLSDTVFFRGQAARLNQDGYVRRGTQKLGGAEDRIARMQLAFEPVERFRATVGVSYTDSESDGNPQVLTRWDMGPDLDFEGNRADWVSDFLEMHGQPRLEPQDDPRLIIDDYTQVAWCFLDAAATPDWDAACEQINASTYRQADLNLQWDVNDAWTLTSITGLSDFDSESITDWVMLGTEQRFASVDSSVFYQELQLNAALLDGRVDLVAGVSWFSEDSDGRQFVRERRGTSVWSFAGGDPGTPPNDIAIGSGPNGLFVVQDQRIEQDARSFGVFANVTLHATDRLRVTPGLRWGEDRKKVVQTRFAADDFTPAVGDSTTVSSRATFDEVDWRLTVDYDLTDDHMIYATGSKAFRAGAYNYTVEQAFTGEQQTEALRTSPPFIPPESVQNTEVGVRTQWMNRRLRLNLTYFDMKYSDRQAAIQQLDETSPTGFIIALTDSGDVDLKGFEFDGQFAATDRLAFDFSAGLLDSTVKDVCANNGEFLFPGPVEESFSLGGRFSVPLRTASNLSFGLNYSYVGSQQTHGGGADPVANNCATPVPGWFFDSRHELPSYGLWNGRARYTTSDGRWALDVFVNNLTDKVYANNATRFGGGFWHHVSIVDPERSALGDTRGRPRSYGVTLQYNFGAAGRR